MKIDDFVVSAQGVLKAAGYSTDFRHGDEVAMYRHETSDRNLEVVARARRWTISYTHLATKKAIRLKGDDAKALEKALQPLCEETAFEPAVHQRRFGGK